MKEFISVIMLMMFVCGLVLCISLVTVEAPNQPQPDGPTLLASATDKGRAWRAAHPLPVVELPMGPAEAPPVVQVVPVKPPRLASEMTLREWYAGQALAGIKARYGNSPDDAAIEAFTMADAMMKRSAP